MVNAEQTLHIVEVPADELARLFEPQLFGELVSHFKELGFNYVTIDLEGFRSGNFNNLIPLEVRIQYSSSQS